MPKTRSPGGEASDPAADLLDRAGDVPAEDHRRIADRLAPAAALARLPVDGIDPGGRDTDEDLGRDRLRPLDLLHLEDLGPSELPHHHRLHAPIVSQP